MTRLAAAVTLCAAAALAWHLAGIVAHTPTRGASAANHIADVGKMVAPSPGPPVALRLPFAAGELWTLTGGAHLPWRNTADPLTAVDFASDTGEGMARAVCDGTVTRADTGRLWLVCTGHNTEVLYLHQRDPAPVGTIVKAGDVVGTPACEGRDLSCNGAHVHLAVMRDGQWVMPALSGWTFDAGAAPYEGGATAPDGARVPRMGRIWATNTSP